MHTGTAHHIFTLPNPPPPNGSCVASGNFAIGAGANVFLSVNSNGLNVDGGTTFPTHPRRSSYLYCSDGSGYWRFGQNQNGVSEIGPWRITGDTGAVNAFVTTFVNGLDFGLNSGTILYLVPINANTSPTFAFAFRDYPEAHPDNSVMIGDCLPIYSRGWLSA